MGVEHVGVFHGLLALSLVIPGFAHIPLSPFIMNHAFVGGLTQEIGTMSSRLSDTSSSCCVIHS